MPKRPRQPPFPDQNSEERVNEILDKWNDPDKVQVSPCAKCGYLMLGKEHTNCV